MTRPHSCFIQAQALSWQASDLSEVRPGVTSKLLSRDAQSGASTQIAAYPAGFQLAAGQSLSSAEELFVLDGALTMGRYRYTTHCYAYLPAGYRRGALSSAHGAVVLSMFSAGVARGAVNHSAAAAIEHRDAFDMSWASGQAGSVTGKPLSATLATKILRRDPASGEQTFLYCSLPHHPPPSKVMPGKFTHPMVEEIFVLDGSFVFGDVGVMGPGGYCYWREGRWHGPVGSATGYHLLIRNLGGPLQNQFSDQPAPFSYSAAYRPQLPPELMPLARPYEPPQRW